MSPHLYPLRMEYMILEQIKLGTPLLWIKTEDVDRINDFVINSKIRDFYSIIPNLGFSKLVDKTWKPVLVDFPNQTMEALPKIQHMILLLPIST